MPGMRVPLWLKIAWTVWVICWAPIYWKQYGVQNFLFFCDVGNLIITLALWSESALLFSWQAVSLLVFQSLFTIDLAGAWLSGHHWIGGTEFMFDPHLPLLVRALVCFTLLRRWFCCGQCGGLGMTRARGKSRPSGCWILVPINYFWRPEHNVNWARGIFFIQQRVVPGWVYLMAYLVLVPAVVYYPTHLGLMWWTRRRATDC